MELPCCEDLQCKSSTNVENERVTSRNSSERCFMNCPFAARKLGFFEELVRQFAPERPCCWEPQSVSWEMATPRRKADCAQHPAGSDTLPGMSRRKTVGCRIDQRMCLIDLRLAGGVLFHFAPQA